MNIKCLFGHKLGKIDNGYQYCERCGKAKTVECNHIWQDVDTQDYSGTTMTYYETSKWNDIKVAQKCKICGYTRHFWRFGH
jgi:hypothetical protein